MKAERLNEVFLRFFCQILASFLHCLQTELNLWRRYFYKAENTRLEESDPEFNVSCGIDKSRLFLPFLPYMKVALGMHYM